MTVGAVPELTSFQREILLETYLLEGRTKKIHVARARGSATVTVIIGEKRLAGDQAVDALSILYSRGLVRQKELNRFVLTAVGRRAARYLHDSRN